MFFNKKEKNRKQIMRVCDCYFVGESRIDGNPIFALYRNDNGESFDRLRELGYEIQLVQSLGNHFGQEEQKDTKVVFKAYKL